MIYGSKTNAYQYDGDCIVEFDDAVYIGRLKPGYPRTGTSAPVEQQPVWQIERIDTVEEEITVSGQNGTITKYTTRRQYPDGNEDYKFTMSQALTYSYEYRH